MIKKIDILRMSQSKSLDLSHGLARMIKKCYEQSKSEDADFRT